MLTLAGVDRPGRTSRTDHRGGVVHSPGCLPGQPPARSRSSAPIRRFPAPTWTSTAIPTAQPTLGVLIVRPDGTVYYVNAQSIQDTVESLLASSPEQIRAVILDLDANDELDITSSEKLAKLVHDLHDQHIRIGFAHFHAPALDMARRAGVFDD